MAQGGSLLLFLVLSYAGIVFGEPYLRQLSGSTDNESNETELTTTLTATTTATTAGTTSIEVIGGVRPADNNALIIVLIIIVVVIVLGLCSAGAYGIVTWRQSSARNNIKLVKQVDTEAADFEANLTSLTQHVQRLNLRLEKEKEKKEVVSKEYAAFQTKWKNVEVQSREFLDLQYTPCFRDRQEWQRGKEQLRRQKQQQRQAEAKRKAAEQMQKDIRKKRAELEKEEQKKQKQRLALAKQQPKAAPAAAGAGAGAAGAATGAGATAGATGATATAGAPAGVATSTAAAVPVIDPPKTPEELDALAVELVKAHQEDSGRAVLVIGATSGNLVPEEEVGFCPETVELTPPAYFSQVYGKSSSGSGRSQKAWRSKDEGRPVVATLVTPADSGGGGGTAGANPVVVAGGGAVASDVAGGPATATHVAGTPAAATHVAGTPSPATHVAGTPAPATHVAGTPAAATHVAGTAPAATPVTGITDF